MKVNDLRDYILIITFIGASILMRFFALENIPGFIGDEAWGYAQIQSYLRDLPYTLSVPSGRTLNPLYALLIYLFPTSDPFGMRLLSVFIGILTILLAFLLFRNKYGNRTASLIALFTSSLPVHIHYSRLAWDCCLIPPTSLILSYFILHRKFVYFIPALVLSFWVHPSLIFFAIPAAVVYLSFRKGEGRTNSPILIVFIAIGGLASAIFYLHSLNLPLYLPQFYMVKRFIYGFLDFITGTIVSLNIKDSRSFFIYPYVLALTGLVYVTHHHLKDVERRFFYGVALTLIPLYVTRGIFPVVPGHERALLYFGFPLCLFLAMLITETKNWRILSTAVSGFYLVITFMFYFEPPITGKIKHLQTRSGPVEPKYAAIRWIIENHKNPESLYIVADDWGIYWNVYNYALGNFPGKIEIRQTMNQAGFDKNLAIDTEEEFTLFMDRSAYAIGFKGGPISKMVYKNMLSGRNYLRVGFSDFEGKEFIHVWVQR